MYSVMWSEHCSYKSSKNYLRRFGQKVSDEMKERLMVGMGQNAGVVDVGEGWAVTFKAESHNHPSFIEPFQERRPVSAASSATSSRWAPAPSRSWTPCASARSTTRTPPASCTA